METTPVAYIETTIPAGVTIDQFRRSRPARPGRWLRVARALHLAQAR